MSLRTAFLAVALCGCVAVESAIAQVPNIQVYSTGTYDQFHIGCYPAQTLTHLYVVLDDWSGRFSAVDFSIQYPPSLVWLTDDSFPVNDLRVTIGNSPQGIAIAWGTCCIPEGVPGEPVLLLTPLVLATGDCQCNTPGVQVGGYTPLQKTQPSLISYPDFVEHAVLGFYTPMCAPIAVESTTWGGIKALYR